MSAAGTLTLPVRGPAIAAPAHCSVVETTLVSINTVISVSVFGNCNPSTIGIVTVLTVLLPSLPLVQSVSAYTSIESIPPVGR